MFKTIKKYLKIKKKERFLKRHHFGAYSTAVLAYFFPINVPALASFVLWETILKLD